MANLDVRFMKVTVRSVKSTHLVNDGNVMSSHSYPALYALSGDRG